MLIFTHKVQQKSSVTEAANVSVTDSEKFENIRIGRPAGGLGPGWLGPGWLALAGWPGWPWIVGGEI